MGNTHPSPNNLNRSNTRQTNHQNYSQSSSNLSKSNLKNDKNKTYNESDSEDSDEQVLFESCLKSKSKSSSNVASKNSNSSNIYVKDSNNLNNNVDSLKRPNSNSFSSFSNSTTAIETPKFNQSSPTSEFGSFFSGLFSGEGAIFPTSPAINKRQPRNDPIFSRFFSPTASNLPSTIFSSQSDRFQNRPKFIHKNGMVYMLIDGKILALPKEQKCQFCNKLINPTKEDFEIHVVKCMTKPRIKSISFVLKECDDVDSKLDIELSQNLENQQTSSGDASLIQDQSNIINKQKSQKELIGVECTICFEEYKYGDTLSRLECFCVFHKQCIDGWMSRKQCCPLHHLMDDDKN